MVRRTASSISRGHPAVLGRADQLPEPGLLPVPAAPGGDGVAQVVQLDAALVLTGPGVGQRLAELGVPEQRRHVLEDDGHAHVVDRRVGQRPDRAVGQRGAAEHPHVAGAREFDCLVQCELGHSGLGYGPCASGSSWDWPASPAWRRRVSCWPATSASAAPTRPTTSGPGCTSGTPASPRRRSPPTDAGRAHRRAAPTASPGCSAASVLSQGACGRTTIAVAVGAQPGPLVEGHPGEDDRRPTCPVCSPRSLLRGNAASARTPSGCSASSSASRMQP